MPTKRKALDGASGNFNAPASKKRSSLKVSRDSTAPTKAAAKYSDEDTITTSEALKLVTFGWPVGSSNDEGNREKGDEDESYVATREVTDRGFPLTSEGLQKFFHLTAEQQKRDQQFHGMYIYNDWTGYGMTEVMDNYLKEFNAILYKKNVSPAKKWAYVEGLATFLAFGDLGEWMMSNNSEAIEEIINIFRSLLLSVYEMLSEHSLLTPTSSIPNIGIITLLMLEFLSSIAGNFDIKWRSEITRVIDKAGVELEPRKELSLTQEGLDEIRAGGKKWKARPFNWKHEYAGFVYGHSGGDEYDISQKSDKWKAGYTFGTKEYNDKMKEMLGSDPEDENEDSPVEDSEPDSDDSDSKLDDSD